MNAKKTGLAMLAVLFIVYLALGENSAISSIASSDETELRARMGNDDDVGNAPSQDEQSADGFADDAQSLDEFYGDEAGDGEIAQADDADTGSPDEPTAPRTNTPTPPIAGSTANGASRANANISLDNAPARPPRNAENVDLDTRARSGF